MSDQKITYDTGAIRYSAGKPRWDLLPYDAVEEVVGVLSAGAIEYGDHNWLLGFPWMDVYASTMRHMVRWVLGQNLDEKSGRPHLAHAACNVLFLLTYYLRKGGKDNRIKIYDNE